MTRTFAVSTGPIALLVLLAGAGLRADQGEEKAREEIQKLGGSVDRDEKAAGKPVVGVSFCRLGVAPEVLAVEALRERFLADASLQPRDEWERRLLEAATDCGVSLSHAAVSSEGLYE